VFSGVGMPKRRLLILANLAEDQEEGIAGEKHKEPVTQA
jgi:hypothetical protein